MWVVVVVVVVVIVVWEYRRVLGDGGVVEEKRESGVAVCSRTARKSADGRQPVSRATRSRRPSIDRRPQSPFSKACTSTSLPL